MKKMTRILSLILVVCTLAGMLMLPAHAAWSEMSVSTSNTIKCYLKDAKNAPTYTSTTLKTKSGSVYTDDEITIRKIGQNSSGEWYAYINYPLTSTGGTKNAYVYLSAITDSKTGGTLKTATAKIGTVYKRAGTTVYKGSYVSKGDSVYVLGTSGSYTQIMYPVSSGWKIAWIKTTTANSYLVNIGVYKQTDSRWASVSYGYSDTKGTVKATIGSGGCGILALTNAVYYLNGKFVPPATIASYSVNNGYRVNGVGTSYGLYKAFASRYGSTYGFSYVTNTTSWATLRTNLNKGYVAICHKSGHIMAIVDYNSSTGKYLLLDSYPSSSRGTASTGYIWATYSYLKNTVGIVDDFYILKSA